MRIVGDIPHPVIKITVFKNDGKFSIKCEAGLLEQLYKFREDEHLQSFEDIQRIVNSDFIQKIEAAMQIMYDAKKEGIDKHLTQPDDTFEHII